jgi:hypothetical protein
MAQVTASESQALVHAFGFIVSFGWYYLHMSDLFS